MLHPRSSSSHTYLPPPPALVHEASHEWQRRTPPGILAAPPSGRGQGSPSGPQSVPTVPVWYCLMSAYEQTFDCQVAFAATPCRPCRVLPLPFKPGGIKGGLGFPK
ncbi:hypothetical protein CesoFtcFv8_009853 [Champsocephalus esox]|uniref:Uncharacterized protein n=1 Tax=Champsocephalus esox TaxID=159716 RepID=A0AAN8GZJ4_9TELE|nr:hypothetical protein CesoFtcFv8_009853 [Champsocephalus esox]